MATIRAKLKQLRDADVKFISLVDRAATRIPFRVLKREKENAMGIDLTGVFKSDRAVQPAVAALVVFAQKNEAVTTQIREAIEKHGFVTDRVQKADNDQTLVYAQQDQPEDTHVVRLGDQLLVSVSGLQVPDGWMGEMVNEHSFFPDLPMATEALLDRIEAVSKSDTPQADAREVLASYASYLDQILVLPASAFKLEEVITDLVTKAEPPTESESKANEKPIPGAKPEGIVEKPAATTKEEAAKAAKKGETEAEKKARAKKHPPAEMAPPDEEDDQKPPPEEVEKCDDGAGIQETLLTALKGVEERVMAQLSGVSQKVETVATEQAAQKKVLDDVVQKADHLDTKLSSTVTAPPVSPDRPANARMRVVKEDTDPRTGNFDTAFLRKRR